jgi:hypothetical protein
MTRRQGSRMVAGTVLVLAAVSACGSSGGGATAAASPSSSGSGSSSQLASCLRSHGLNVPTSGGTSAVRSAMQSASASQRSTALHACHQYLGGGGFQHRAGGTPPAGGFGGTPPAAG